MSKVFYIYNFSKFFGWRYCCVPSMNFKNNRISEELKNVDKDRLCCIFAIFLEGIKNKSQICAFICIHARNKMVSILR